ncbi:MAG: hypothetical protein KF688_06865 [Pirellulales bacterium]|nr:hypothetical protein [Pirellulales bacterium]
MQNFFRACMLLIVPDMAFAVDDVPYARLFPAVNHNKPITVEILQESDESLTVFDIQAGSVKQVTPQDFKEIRRGLTEDAIASRVDPTRLFAWKIRKAMPLKIPKGAIATVDFAAVYVNLGIDDGLEVGQDLAVYRGATEIRDPTTNEVLDRIRRLIGNLQVVEVRNRISKCRNAGQFEIEFKVGDEVEPKQPPTIAVFPIEEASGEVTADSMRFTEQLTTALADAGIPLVERTRLADALTELEIQQSDLFRADGAKKVGGLLGASAIVVGQVSDEGDRLLANLRLTKVSTGEIILSHSAEVARSDVEGGKPREGFVAANARSGATNLLTVGPAPLFRKGNWQTRNGQLLYTGNNGDGAVAFLLKLPDQFRLTVRATPSGVTQSTCVAFYFGEGGTEFIVQLAEDGSCVIVDGKDPRSDHTAKYGAVFVSGRTNTIQYECRKGGLMVSVNGRRLLVHRDQRLGESTANEFSFGVLGDWVFESADISRH